MEDRYLFRGFCFNKNGTKTIWLDGKEIKGEWVEGSLNQWISSVYNNEKKQPNKSWIRENDSTTRWGIEYPVIPETVGQYLPKFSIFEGDYCEIYWKGEIVYKGLFEWSDKWQGYFITHNKVLDVYSPKFEKCNDLGIDAFCEEGWTFEVIGNVFENKELVEGK